MSAKMPEIREKNIYSEKHHIVCAEHNGTIYGAFDVDVQDRVCYNRPTASERRMQRHS